ncbi:MAG: DUF2971 domain-containing protein [Fimbriimonadaceae bacterium]|nr:DUF2971 domain-containing protein [Alphaproteobacteria bacterium]
MEITERLIGALGIPREQVELSRVFMPQFVARIDDISKNDTRFAHYTSADAAMRILENQEIWMRHSHTMNDYLELEYGLDLLTKTYKDGEKGKRFKDVVNKIHPGASEMIQDQFDSWIPHFRDGTYITCISEHSSTDDEHGKLSMWRAYGRPCGVALILNNGPLLRGNQVLQAFASAVEYLSEAEFGRKFDELSVEFEDNIQLLSKLDLNSFVLGVTMAFRAAMQCTKHPGFSEEKEWRVFHTPEYDGTSEVPLDL